MVLMDEEKLSEKCSRGSYCLKEQNYCRSFLTSDVKDTHLYTHGGTSNKEITFCSLIEWSEDNGIPIYITGFEPLSVMLKTEYDAIAFKLRWT